MSAAQPRIEREASKAERAVINQFLAQPPPGVNTTLFSGVREVEPTGPEPSIAPAAIAKERKYIFRSRPGTVAKHRIRIPATPPPGAFETDKRYDYVVERYARKYGDKLATFDDLVERNGGQSYIDFITHEVPIPGRQEKTRECSFQTDDPLLAAFVRQSLANKGQFYEDVPALTVNLGGKQIDITVTNDAERAAVLAALLRQGQAVEYAGAGPRIDPDADDDDDPLPEVVPPSLRDKNGKPLVGAALKRRLAKLAAAG